jgi:hypothetical protein
VGGSNSLVQVQAGKIDSILARSIEGFDLIGIPHPQACVMPFVGDDIRDYGAKTATTYNRNTFD